MEKKCGPSGFEEKYTIEEIKKLAIMADGYGKKLPLSGDNFFSELVENCLKENYKEEELLYTMIFNFGSPLIQDTLDIIYITPVEQMPAYVMTNEGDLDLWKKLIAEWRMLVGK